MGPENESPERDDMPDRDQVPDGIEGTTGRESDPEGNTTVNITVTSQDPELQAIEATLVVLQMLTYDTRRRAMRYVAERLGWRLDHMGGDTVPSVAVARVLAESDGRDWSTMTDTHRSPYIRRAHALAAQYHVIPAVP